MVDPSAAWRAFGVPAGFAAALLLALSPIAVAADRSNNTDCGWCCSCCWRRCWPCAAAARPGGLHGAAGHRLQRQDDGRPGMRAGATRGVVAHHHARLAPTRDGWRRAAPPIVVRSPRGRSRSHAQDRRPYAGSSHDNSMLELIVMHNALERFVRPERATTAGTPPAPAPRFPAYDNACRSDRCASPSRRSRRNSPGCCRSP